MNDSLPHGALARLLALNNQVHDLESQLRREIFPPACREFNAWDGAAGPNPIAAMQEEIDQGVRASLVMCWLGMDSEPEM